MGESLRQGKKCHRRGPLRGSTITVENAYEQLIGEGYLYAVPKKGYYVADISGIKKVGVPQRVSLNIVKPKEKEDVVFDFSTAKTERANFPFSIWAKLMRETISQKEKELLTVSPCEGVQELREAIASHLSSFRGMVVDPDQIIVGAGTEYLYGLLIKLLGNDKIYCIENPGYKKLKKIYESYDVVCQYANMEDKASSSRPSASDISGASEREAAISAYIYAFTAFSGARGI